MPLKPKKKPTTKKGGRATASAPPAKKRAAPSSAKKPAKGAKRSSPRKAPAHDGLQPLLSAWPPLSEVHRDAFRSLLGEEEAEALGNRTVAEKVLADVQRWAPVIDRALRDHPYELRRYGAPRFVWMLECANRLDEAVTSQQVASSSPEGQRRALARAEARATDVLEDLATATSVVAASQPPVAEKIAAARSLADGGDAVSALRALADVADELGRSYDQRTRALVASVGLHSEDAASARAASAALEAAKNPTAGAGSKEDLPTTNRIEGRVLSEMRFAKAMFDRARARDPRIPVLEAGPGTRSVLAG